MKSLIYIDHACLMRERERNSGFPVLLEDTKDLCTNLCVFALSVKQRLESEAPICFAVRSRKVFHNILHFFTLLNKYLK